MAQKMARTHNHPPPSTALSGTRKEKEKEENQIGSDAMRIWFHMRRHDKLLSLKRSFVAGLCEPICFDEKTSSRSVGGYESMLPESVMRKDDVFYEDVYELVERCFGKADPYVEQSEIHNYPEFLDFHNTSRIILTFLDDLSNNGLYNLTKLVTRGLVKFVKTRPQMKRVIKNSLLEIQSGKFPSNYQVTFRNELSKLLKNPKNFRQNFRKHVKLTWSSCTADVMTVLNGLKDMPTETLMAMYRKLKGTQGYMPQFRSPQSGFRRNFLMRRIRDMSSEMIAQTNESDGLPEPLAKAMAVACLSSEIASCSQHFSVPKYLYVTPEVEALQNEILKAIRLLSQKLHKNELMKLRGMFDPDCETKGPRLPEAVRKMLIQFLFECSDMDVVPEYLLDAVSFINKKIQAHGYLSNDLLEEDVECILNLSAHFKQIFWDCDSSNQLDQHFADAYMEELDDSDDGDFFSDDDDHESQIRFNGFTEEVGSTEGSEDAKPDLREGEESAGGVDDASFQSPPSVCKVEMDCTNEFPCPKLVDGDYSNTKPIQNEVLASAGNCLEQKLDPGSQRNRYVDIQEVCDDASVVAYHLIGHILDKFGQMEASGLDSCDESYLRGDNSRLDHYEGPVENSMDKDARGSIILEAVNRVIPSFSSSQLELLKKYVSS